MMKKHSIYKPTNFIKMTYNWAVYLAKGILRSSQYISLLPPWFSHQYLYDRNKKNIVKILIRDRVDYTQMEHIYLREEYNLNRTGRLDAILRKFKAIKDLGGVPLIIDCGANIGLATKYFNAFFDGASLIGVEPDPENIKIARKNNIKSNANFIEAGISSQAGSGNLIDMGSSNSFRTVADPGGTLRFITIDEILKKQLNSTPFLIKIDIEGFESNLFTMNTDWIDKFPIIIIELHDWLIPNSNSSKSFLRAISKRDRDFIHYDGFVVSYSSDL